MPRQLAGVTADSRTVARDFLFVALPGAHADGHDFVGEAFRRGAAGAVVRAEYAPGARAGAGPLLRTADPLRAMQAMAAGYRRTQSIRIVGVTGSAGKTTVKEMTADVLAVSQPVARTRGNWNNAIGLPLSLLNMPPGARAGVFEAGINHPGEMEELCRILAPDWGVVTNVGPVHLAFFSSEEAIARAKAALLRALPPDGLAVLRADASWYRTLRAAAPCPVITVALAPDQSAGPPDFYAREEPDGMAVFGERAAKMVWRARPPLPGRHNLANMLFAAAVGRAWGIGWPDIIRTLENYQPPPMRWDAQVWRNVTLINDAYNANPMSMAEALLAYRSLPGGRKWLVLGGMLELGETAPALHRELGREIAAGDWQGLVAVGTLAEWIADGAESCGMPPERISRCAGPLEAAALLAQSMRPGDMVLLKGSRGIGLENVLRALAEMDKPSRAGAG